MITTSNYPVNLFDMYFALREETEPPVIFHRWSLICCIAALLGKQCWVPFGSSRIFPNQYVMLIGEPGSRKSTAIKDARKVLSKAGYSNYAAEKTTKEKFLLDLEGLEELDDAKVGNDQVMQNLFGDHSSMEPKEVFVVADEFNDFMRCGDLEFHSMLGALWDYDDETTLYKQRLKNSKSIAIYQPTINLLGGNTHTGFAEMFPPQAIGQGFLSRMILIFSEPSGKKIAFPPTPDAAKEQLIVKALQRIKAEFVGPIELTQKAKDVLHVLYHNYEGFADVRFTAYFTRRYTHLLKLCLICAAVKQKKAIGIEEVILANTILKYAEHFMPKALGEFGKAKNADVANKVLKLLGSVNKPVDVPDIWKQVSSDLDRMEDLMRLLEGLRTAGKIQWVKKTERGVQGYLIVRKALGQAELYCDYTLLKEFEYVQL